MQGGHYAKSWELCKILALKFIDIRHSKGLPP